MPGPWEKYQRGGPTVLPAPPKQQYEVPRIQGQIRNTDAQTVNTATNTARTRQQMQLDREKHSLEKEKFAADQEAAQAEKAKLGKQQKIAMRDAIQGLRLLDRIEASVYDGGFGETGFWGSMMGKVPGTDAYDVRNDVKDIKGLGILNTLIQSKTAMPTGAQGLFGATNAAELEALAATIGNLDADTSNEQFLKKIRDGRRGFASILRGINPEVADVYTKARNDYEKQFGFGGFGGDGNDDIKIKIIGRR